MSTAAKRPSIFRKSAHHVDENGVPTIQSSNGLIFLGFGLFISVPLTALALFQTFSMAFTGEATNGVETWALRSDYRVMLWVTGNLRAAYFGWMCLAAYNFFSQRSAAPRMLVQMFAGGIALNLLEGWWEASFADGDEAYRAQVIGEAVRGVFWSVVWIIFLKRSRAVPLVFAYPLPEKSEPLEIVEFVEGEETLSALTSGAPAASGRG
jgi:hypothetical protein